MIGSEFELEIESEFKSDVRSEFEIEVEWKFGSDVTGQKSRVKNCRSEIAGARWGLKSK